MSLNEKLKKIADYYGYEHQLVKTIDEMSELTHALCNGVVGSIVEEMADVWNMLLQMEYLLGKEYEAIIVDTMNYKADRQLRRIEDGEDG